MSTDSKVKEHNEQCRREILANSFHPNWPVMPGHTSVSQVAGCRCTLLAGNSSISLAGSE